MAVIRLFISLRAQNVRPTVEWDCCKKHTGPSKKGVPVVNDEEVAARAQAEAPVQYFLVISMAIRFT